MARRCRVMTGEKPLPKLTSDAEVECFIDTADLTEFELLALKTHRFEFEVRSELPTGWTAKIPTT